MDCKNKVSIALIGVIGSPYYSNFREIITPHAVSSLSTVVTEYLIVGIGMAEKYDFPLKNAPAKPNL